MMIFFLFTIACFCFIVARLLLQKRALARRIEELRRGSLSLRSEKELLLDMLDEAILTIDPEGKITSCNAKAKQVLLEAKTFFFTDSSLSKRAAALLKECLHTKNQLQAPFTIEEGTKSYFDLTARPLNRGGALLIVKDISSHHKIVEMGKDFIANASHELRTPVTIIKGFAETLRDITEISETMFDSILEKILRNCGRMEALVRNLLTLTDLDHKSHTHLQPCDLVALMENCCHTAISLYPDLRIETLFNKDDICVLGDPDLLELALANILQNAAKYSSPPREISVTIEAREHETLLCIADNGIGIPAEDQPHIFDRFYTVNKSHSRKLGGAGLGLSIVKAIMEKHHAIISCTSKIDAGTAFTFAFPHSLPQKKP